MYARNVMIDDNFTRCCWSFQNAICSLVSFQTHSANDQTAQYPRWHANSFEKFLFNFLLTHPTNYNLFVRIVFFAWCKFSNKVSSQYHFYLFNISQQRKKMINCPKNHISVKLHSHCELLLKREVAALRCSTLGPRRANSRPLEHIGSHCWLRYISTVDTSVSSNSQNVKKIYKIINMFLFSNGCWLPRRCLENVVMFIANESLGTQGSLYKLLQLFICVRLITYYSHQRCKEM